MNIHEEKGQDISRSGLKNDFNYSQVINAFLIMDWPI